MSGLSRNDCPGNAGIGVRIAPEYALDLPENFGKTWSKDDEEVLYDMIELACTCRQMAEELKRHPVSVATRLARYLDDESLQDRLNEDTYDVPVKELIDWD